MLALLLALAAAHPPSETSGRAKSLFSYEDYPAEALYHHWEGTVVAELTVSPQGVPSACRIVKSSGHKVLDDATCNIMMTRARFVPASDENDNPTEDTVRAPPIEWRIRY